MTTATTELIAEARGYAHSGQLPAPAHGYILGLADALEAATAAPSSTENTLAQVKRYLERFGPGDMHSQRVMAEALRGIIDGAGVAWAPSDANIAAPSDTDEVLAMLDDLNASGGIAYDDYSRLHDAVARLAPAADEVEPAYELLPGTREALDALTIRPDGFWTDSREGHFRATGCDGTVCSVMHPDSAAWVEVNP